MLKKLSVLFAVTVFMTVFGAGLAWATVDGTAHATSIGSQGTCSACHMPHKSPSSKRLWPASMTSVPSGLGEVGALCYYCHGTGGGKGTAASVQTYVTATATDAKYSHGLIKLQNPGGGDGVAASGLPYVGNTTMECTTCHDVHSDTNRPFLRLPIDVICANCHLQRMYKGGAAYTLGATIDNWGAFYGDSNPGTHPVGLDITTDTSGAGNSPITFDAAFNVAKSAIASEWSLGGHRTSGATGGVTCTTCHAPHGQDLDTAHGTGTPPWLWLLIKDQKTADSMADGDGLARNAECEACHVTSGATWDPGTGAAYAGTLKPNPGGTAYTHPCDNLGAEYAGSVPNGADFPAGGGSWPVGSAAGTNMSPAVICESCHTPHGLANQALNRRAADYVIVGANSHILRDDELVVCGECHTGQIPGHHPTGAYSATRFVTTNIGDNATPLTCGDCHNGTGAHNWTLTAGVGLDPDWIPANNGRGSDRAAENNAGASTTCEDCHMLAGFSEPSHYSPTINSVNGGAAPAASALSGRTRGSYQDEGDGTHYLGKTSLNYAAGYLAGAAFNARTDVWTSGKGGNGGWSRFASADTGHVVCESCHELEPDRNTGTTMPMLLGTYKEGSTTDPSGFCEACHSATPGGANPHPMTGDSISRAALDPLYSAAATLKTSGRGSFAKALGSWTSPSTAPAGDALNCDSCHQPHDAATSGGTYIYDAVPTNVTATTAPSEDTTRTGVAGHPPTGATSAGLQDMKFCNQCHSY